MLSFRSPCDPALLRAMLFMAAVHSFAGCGGPQTVITGTVRLDGNPLVGATLDMFPVAGVGRVSTAKTDANGRYQTTASPVRLSIVVLATIVDGQIPDSTSGEMIDAVRSVVPKRYGSHDTTPLTAEPVEGQTTTVDFELTSK